MATVFNPYKVLGVSENATQDEIKSAFRKLSKENHPDSNNGDSKNFIEIKKAYEILIHKEKRDTYDLYGVVIDFPEESKNLAFTIFLDVATRCPEGCPLDNEIKSFIMLNLVPRCEGEMKAAEEKRKLLESRLLGIVNKPDDDFISERALKVIAECEHAYKMAMLKRDLHKSALELLQKYKFNLEQIESAKNKSREDDEINILAEAMFGTNIQYWDYVMKGRKRDNKSYRS
jgi:curved DNA-binding protein CbpA